MQHIKNHKHLAAATMILLALGLGLGAALAGPGLREDGDVYVAGTLSANVIVLPNNVVKNANVAVGGSGLNIAYTKLTSQRVLTYEQPNTTTTTATVPLYVAQGATGAVLYVRAGNIVKAVGAATVTVDVQKNGTTILSSVITLDSTNTNRVVEAGTVSVPAYSTGSWFDVIVTATAGGGTLPTGLYVDMGVAEDPQ